MQLNFYESGRRLRRTAYFLVAGSLFFSACQEALRRQTVTEPPVVGWSAEGLDSLAAPLFAQLVRDDRYVNAYGFAANDLVTYDDSVYAQRIAAIESAVPLFYDEDVRNYINLYAQRKKELTERMIGKSAWYYPMIEPVLAAEQMPNVLKHLTMVESAMHLKAASAKSAVGLWQIRPATGRSLGLEVSPLVDQRRDPIASSRAATVYLKKLYQRYGDWYLAIAAYNYGIGNINKAIARATAAERKAPTSFFELRPYLPAETRSYVPAFVAVVYLYHYQQEHNLRPAYFDLPFREVDTAYISAPFSLEQASQTYRVGVDVLNFLNPALVRGVVPVQPMAYPLAIPTTDVATTDVATTDVATTDVATVDTGAKSYALLPPATPVDSALVRQVAQVVRRAERVVPNPERMAPVVHLIEKGNTLASIAQQYDCTVHDLVHWNGLYDATIWSGDELVVYVPRLVPEQGAIVRR
jgi:membrane-bound lytic murein transglycosylase D